MRQGDPSLGTGPATPPDPRARVRTLLAIWTGVLGVAGAAGLRSLPPVLVGLLVPYLALVACHLLAPPGRQPSEALDTRAGEENIVLASPDAAPMPAVSEARAEASDYSEVVHPPVEPGGPPAPKPRTMRRRRRERPATLGTSSVATFVPVAPGRYMRREEPDPAPQAAPDAPGNALADPPRAESPGESPSGEPRDHGTGDAVEGSMGFAGGLGGVTPEVESAGALP